VHYILPRRSEGDVEEALCELERTGHLYRYQVGGALYIASCKHEKHQAWKSRRLVPEYPMTQEVADTRDWTKLLVQGARADQTLAKLGAWAIECGISVEREGVRYGVTHNVSHGKQEPLPCDAQCVTDVSHGKGVSVRVRVGVREGEGGACVTPDEPADGDAPTPSPTQSPNEELPKPARDALAHVGCYDWHEVSQLVDAQAPHACGTNMLGYVLATALACEKRSDPDRVFRAKLRDHDKPTREQVLRAERMLKPAGKPPRGPTCDTDGCECTSGLVQSTLPDRPGRYCADCYSRILDQVDAEPDNVIQFADLQGVRATREEARDETALGKSAHA
jgi:hypothetical protein